jgi:hypothetical protein
VVGRQWTDAALGVGWAAYLEVGVRRTTEHLGGLRRGISRRLGDLDCSGTLHGRAELLALDAKPFVVRVGEAAQLGGPVPGVGGAVHSARVVGASSARRRIVAPVCGVRQVAANMSSASRAGPTNSLLTRALLLPTAVNRSPHSRVPVVSS